MSHPLVSVIIPVYNGAATITRCIESVLAQYYPSERYETIVVDNDSTDETFELIQRYPITVLKETKKGSASARNCGLAHARGEIVAFTDADCFAEPHWLEELVKPFSDPVVGGVGGAIKSASMDTAVERYSDYRGVVSHRFPPAMFLPYLVTANAAFRKVIVDAVGGFDEALVKSSMDVDISWRIQLASPCWFHFAEKAIVHHKHRDSISGLIAQNIRYHSEVHALHSKFSRYEAYPVRRVRDTLYLYRKILLGHPAMVVGRSLKRIASRGSRDEMLFSIFEWVWDISMAYALIKATLTHRRYYL
jgi:glycosyltransferase involved in cell wall biosynthesis